MTLLQQAAAHLKRAVTSRVDTTLGRVYLVLGAGAALGVGIHQAALQDAGVLGGSHIGPALWFAVAAACVWGFVRRPVKADAPGGGP